MMNNYVIDYGCGNIGSIVRMSQKVGYECHIAKSVEEIIDPEHIILAGVGAFDYGMACLHDNGWVETLNYHVIERKIPVLGICLGMQLMCNDSEEGERNGLGWINGSVRRFPSPQETGLKVPHMGWNAVRENRDDSCLYKRGERERFYFVHSYYVECKDRDDVMMTCNYGLEFIAGFQRENIVGVQFHPEKSHKYGMSLFRRFYSGTLSC